MNEIVMPKLSDTMTEGRLVSWKKRVGDAVGRGDVLAEVETDKANMELEAFTSGVLLEIRVQPGELVQVGTVIAVIGSEQEKGAASGAQENLAQAPMQPESAGTGAESQGAATGQHAAPAQGQAATPAPGPAAEAAPAGAGEPAKVQQATEGQAPTEVQVPTGNQVPAAAEAPAELQAKADEQGRADAQAKAEAETKAKTAAPAPATGGQPPGQAEPQPPRGEEVSGAAVERAAPVVRRRARELGIDLSQVAGSGPEGRILLQDLEQRQGKSAPAPGEAAGANGTAAPAGAPAAVSGSQAAGVAPMSRLRSAVARTVAESWRTIPHFNVTIDVLMDEAEAVRRQLKAGGIAVTLNDLIVKGMALALAKFPRLNASFAAEGIVSHDQMNIGVAVGVPEGVLIPVIPGCQGLSLQEIAGRSRDLVEQARKGALTEKQMSGGTISVSNLGMYGVSEFNAIIYPHQAAVLAVGAVTDAVVVRAGIPSCVRLMKLTLCSDHRVVDGAYAAEFLAELKSILENPVRLLI